MIIDFTDLPKRKKTYSGANGSKISVVYNDEIYMLKFPSPPSINKKISYANGCISEYLGSHIFNIIGIPAQETILGTYKINGKQKIVVACRDFTVNGTVLQDFGSLKNAVVDSYGSGYGTELENIIEAIDEQQMIDPKILNDFFWNMFIVDALLGNWDRHNGNWGFLYDFRTDEITLAPVYDCGSCLYPQADDTIMRNCLKNENERNIRIFERPLSCIKIDGKKINYYNFISSLQNIDCNRALKRIYPKIDIEKIYNLIDKTPFITDLQKEFYKTMICKRKEAIIDYSFKKLKRNEN